MRKYLYILLSLTIVPLIAKAENEASDFEAELRNLETREMAQIEKEDAMIDSVNEQKAGVVKETIKELETPIPATPKKTRRIPSR
jgi:hypothetical protein